jgi:hypothetical protein
MLQGSLSMIFSFPALRKKNNLQKILDKQESCPI